jgi:hypothetical protein
MSADKNQEHWNDKFEIFFAFFLGFLMAAAEPTPSGCRSVNKMLEMS